MSAEKHSQAFGNCADGEAVFSWGVSPMRQLPSPSAAGWLFDLGGLGGPWMVVLRDTDVEAVQRLAEHLVDLGQATDVEHAMQLLADAPLTYAGVVW